MSWNSTGIPLVEKLGSGGDDSGKVRGFEAGSPDKRSVNVGFGKEFLRVVIILRGPEKMPVTIKPVKNLLRSFVSLGILFSQNYIAKSSNIRKSRFFGSHMVQ